MTLQFGLDIKDSFSNCLQDTSDDTEYFGEYYLAIHPCACHALLDFV